MPPNIDIAPNTATVRRLAIKTRAPRRRPPDAEALPDRESFISPPPGHGFHQRRSLHQMTHQLYEFSLAKSTLRSPPLAAVTTFSPRCQRRPLGRGSLLEH